MLLLNIWLWG